MERDRLDYLMQRYFARECTAEEKEELALLIDVAKNDELKSQLFDQWNIFSSSSMLSENKSELILQNILTPPVSEDVIYSKNKLSVFRILTLTAVAASVVILFSLGLFLQKSETINNSSQKIVAKAPVISPQKQAPFTRNVTLPDGSVVVLHAGSTINYPPTFVGKTREIALVGEAYFDIKHDSKRPFIIHTGKVKTTVLGTAFDIKAWPNQKNVIVSVTRGKVRVENEQKVLAVLTINQQLNYDFQHAVTKQGKVNAEDMVNDWTRNEMNFDGVTLESIAQILSKRYGKNISISNMKLANTQIVSSFSGTESLESILDVLCTINSDAQFAVSADEVLISNKNRIY